MQDTQIVIVLNSIIFTVLINECNGGDPWLARYGATMDGAPCELADVDTAMVEAFDIPEQVSWNSEHDDALEAAWDRILVPALFALKLQAAAASVEAQLLAACDELPN